MEKTILFFSRFPAGAHGGGGSHREAQLAELLRPLGYRYLSCWDLEHMRVRGRRRTGIFSRLRRTFSPGRDFWADENTWEYVLDMRTAARKWRGALRGSGTISLVVLDDPLYFSSLVEHVHGKGIPLVALCQNLESLSPGQLNRKRQLELLHREISLLKKCAMAVTISREETFLLRNLGIPAIYLPYDPVPSIRERLLRVRERRAHGRKQGFLALGNVGNRSTLAGMKALIEYWSRRGSPLRDEKLLVAGFWTPSFLKFQPAPNTVFLGEVSDAELDDLLSSVRAMICYQQSGSGALTKIREMLLAGVPVLANAHASRSYHEYDGAGLVEFAELDDLDKAAVKIGARGAAGESPFAAMEPPDDPIARAGRELLARLNALIDRRQSRL